MSEGRGHDDRRGSVPPGTEAWFEVRSDDTDRLVALSEKDFWTLGRGDDCDVVLRSNRVSRKHAVLRRFQAGGYHLSDDDSRNGTFVNGRQVRSRTRLYDGDRIDIGPYRLLFRRADGTVISFAGDRTDFDVTSIDRRIIDVTVLVGDVRGFGNLTRDFGEARTGDILHDWCAAVDGVVRRNGGEVDKFVGDQVMALWRHEPELGSDVNAAVAAGLELFDATAEVNRKHELEPSMHIGVGLHTGRAAVGSTGAKGSADFTVLGDAVNIAFRLESATREADVPMLVSDDIAQLGGWDDPGAAGLTMHHLRLKHVENTVAAWSGSPAEFERVLGPRD